MRFLSSPNITEMEKRKVMMVSEKIGGRGGRGPRGGLMGQ